MNFKEEQEKHRNMKKEDYTCLYLYRKHHLWKEVYNGQEDLSYPLVLSYIDPKDLAYFKNNGKSPDKTYPAKIAEEQYQASMNIKEAFKLIEDVFVTKKENKEGKRETLTASVKSLNEYQEELLQSLLNYLRTSWSDGERGDVQLTWKEFFLLKNGKFKKFKGKKK